LNSFPWLQDLKLQLYMVGFPSRLLAF